MFFQKSKFLKNNLYFFFSHLSNKEITWRRAAVCHTFVGVAIWRTFWTPGFGFARVHGPKFACADDESGIFENPKTDMGTTDAGLKYLKKWGA